MKSAKAAALTMFISSGCIKIINIYHAFYIMAFNKRIDHNQSSSSVSELKLHDVVLFFMILIGFMALQSRAFAQQSQTIDLTFENAVNLSLGNSYRIQYLEIGVQQTQRRLEAQRANLRSRVDMQLAIPDFQIISDQQYDSDLQRNVIVRENSRMWRMDLSVRQPVILFGYPTNGYLSLNNRVYRFSQIVDEERDVRYYNRYFVAYEQPLFQPNELKNDLENANLNLEDEELDYLADVVDIIVDAADDYYGFFETIYERVILESQLENLNRALEIARNDTIYGTNTLNQIQVELANAREELGQADSEIRLTEAEFKQELRLDETTSLYVEPVIEVNPIQVNVERAVQYGISLRPWIRQLEINRRRQEIDLEEEKGRGAFQLNLEASYGREMQNSSFENLFEAPSNSYTFGVNARIPILDWGARSARIQAEELDLRRTDLQMEEASSQIESDIQNAIETLQEYQNRALTMQENVELARSVMNQSFESFRTGGISAFELIQNILRLRDTEENFLQAYLGFRESIVNVQELTFYDFETNQPLLDLYYPEMGS